MRLLAMLACLGLATAACGAGSDLPSGRWSVTGDDPSPSASSEPGDAGVDSGTDDEPDAASAAGPDAAGPGATKANLGVSLDQTSLQMQLMASAEVKLTVAPKGYVGTATPSAATLPSGVTASFSPATLKLDGKNPATVTVTLKTASAAAPGTATAKLAVAAGGKTFSSPVSIEVQSVLTIHIPAGVNGNGGTASAPVTTAYGPYPMPVVAPASIATHPVTVYFMNDDAVEHEIHADNPDQGFGHDPGPIPAHTMDSYVRMVTVTGSYQYYLHDQGAASTVGLVEIQ